MDGSGPSQVANLTYRLIKVLVLELRSRAGEVDIAELVPPLICVDLILVEI